MVGSGLVLTMLSFGSLAAWSQSEPKSVADWSTHDTASVMDQNVSREIKQAWLDDKDATGAMAFQENGEIAMNEGKEREAKQYFHAAEEELATLTPEHTDHTDY
jgi:hypothetical protein